MSPIDLVAEVQRLRAALEWCIREGGWRLFYHAHSEVPDVFDTSDTFNVRLKPPPAPPAPEPERS